MYFILAREGSEGKWQVARVKLHTKEKALEAYALECKLAGSSNVELVKDLNVAVNSTYYVSGSFPFNSKDDEFTVYEDRVLSLPEDADKCNLCGNIIDDTEK